MPDAQRQRGEIGGARLRAAILALHRIAHNIEIGKDNRAEAMTRQRAFQRGGDALQRLEAVGAGIMAGDVDLLADARVTGILRCDFMPNSGGISAAMPPAG